MAREIVQLFGTDLEFPRENISRDYLTMFLRELEIALTAPTILWTCEKAKNGFKNFLDMARSFAQMKIHESMHFAATHSFSQATSLSQTKQPTEPTKELLTSMYSIKKL